jgi:hypothetical protein
MPRPQTGEWSCNPQQIFSFCAGPYFWEDHNLIVFRISDLPRLAEDYSEGVYFGSFMYIFSNTRTMRLGWIFTSPTHNAIQFISRGIFWTPRYHDMQKLVDLCINISVPDR